ncbi:hypothetical protein BKA70DRAFT_1576184 [Coprinopsis sp. MPI-PUGE-AT-0042]|nr:hypothetical protein BKA70DRAFT_1576184 [Coprinopsis sp. MPI-PUGE-AT-0042]
MSRRIIRPQASQWGVIDGMDLYMRYTGPGRFNEKEAKEALGDFSPTYLSTLPGTNADAEPSFIFIGQQQPSKPIQCYRPKLGPSRRGSVGPTAPSPIQKTIGVSVIGRTAFLENARCVRASSRGQSFYVDKIDYIPLPGTIMASGQVVSVDHTDEAIRYGGVAWSRPHSRGRRMVKKQQLSLSYYNWKTSQGPNYGNEHGGTYTQVFSETSPPSRGPHRLIVDYGGDRQTTPLALIDLLIELPFDFALTTKHRRHPPYHLSLQMLAETGQGGLYEETLVPLRRL